jgi:Holliday junction resolvase
MVDSRIKGATAETKVRDELRKLTGLKWERVPGSGALHEKHGLKGDLYLVGTVNHYCVEVKHYKDDHINTGLLTHKQPQLIDWWEQTIRESKQVDKKPLLIYKHDRSKLFAAFLEMPSANYRYLFVDILGHQFYTSLLEDYIKYEQPKFTN